MAELLSGNRLEISKNAQREFLEKCSEKLGLSNTELASLLNVSVRTLTDWKRRKFLLPERVAIFLSNKSKIPIPQFNKIVDQFWYTKKGAQKGALVVLKKYGRVGGEPESRKIAWLKWWEEIGKFQKRKIFSRKPILKPNNNTELAEFVGIMLGDGGITKNQITISLNSETDSDYIIYVKNLITKLFKVKPNLRKDKNSLATYIVISRIELVDFLQNIGLKVGNKVKQQVDIPQWIKSEIKLSIACMRGLIDTDGSIFEHKYRVGKKTYKYKKMDFSSSSQPLLKSAYEILSELGLKPRVTKNGKKLMLDSVESISKYFLKVGSSNQKHLKRYRM